MKTYFCEDCEVRFSELADDRDHSMCIAIDSDAAHEIASALRACAGIPDPEVTIPALVEFLERLPKVLIAGRVGSYDGKTWDLMDSIQKEASALLCKLNPSDT